MQRNRKILRRKNQPIKTNPKHTDVKINRQEHFKRYFSCIPYIQNVERGEYITKKKKDSNQTSRDENTTVKK